MRYFLPALFLFLFTTLTAQPGELTEQQVKYQQQFIEAKREALLGKTDKAISMFETLLEAQPQNDPALFELGRLQYAAGNSPEAIDALRRAYDLRPNEIYAAFLGELYQTSGRYRDGADLYGELIKKNPAAAENYLERAAFLVRAQDVKEAVNVYNELEKRIGVNAELARHKHALYLGTGDQKRAEKELTALVEAFPQQLEYRHLLAGYYRSQKDEKNATSVYREILEIEPADVRAQLALQDATPSPAGGNDDDLMALFARTDVDLDLKIGKVLPLVQQVANTQDRALADRVLILAQELARVHPDEAKATAIIGDLYSHSGRPGEAAMAYRTTLELDDTVYPVWEQLLTALYLNNEMVALREYGEEALDIFPNRPAVYMYYALGEAFRGDFAEADNLAQQAQLMVSGNPEAAAALQTLLTAFKDMGSSQPNPPSVKFSQLPGGDAGAMATYLKQRAEPQPASLLALDQPANTNALLLELMGDAQREAGDKAAAAKFYQRAKAAGSKTPTLSRKISQVNG